MSNRIKRIISSVVLAVIAASSTVFLSADASADSYKYYKYVRATDTVTTYELELEPYSATSSSYNMSRGVIGDDNRTRRSTNGVVHIEYGGKTGGTGFIIGDHTIVTAAHCVVNFSNLSSDVSDEEAVSADDFLDNIVIRRYNSSGFYDGSELMTPVEIHVPCKRRTSNANQKQLNDFALITVAQDLSAYTHFNLGIAYDTGNTNSLDIPVLATGFPGDLNENANSHYLMYTGFGHISTDTPPDPGLLYFDADVEAGTSGGPVYTVTRCTVGNTTYTSYTAISLVGVSHDDVNWGPRFDSRIIQFYHNNPYIGY